MMETRGSGQSFGFNGALTPQMGSSPTDDEGGGGGKPTSRWLNTEHYSEALEGFDLYDPEEWLPTLNLAVSDFMFWPWTLITGFCFILTVAVQIFFPDYLDWVDQPIDAHVILGGALSFLIVMRTDAS